MKYIYAIHNDTINQQELHTVFADENVYSYLKLYLHVQNEKPGSFSVYIPFTYYIPWQSNARVTVHWKWSITDGEKVDEKSVLFIKMKINKTGWQIRGVANINFLDHPVGYSADETVGQMLNRTYWPQKRYVRDKIKKYWENVLPTNEQLQLIDDRASGGSVSSYYIDNFEKGTSGFSYRLNVHLSDEMMFAEEKKRLESLALRKVYAEGVDYFFFSKKPAEKIKLIIDNTQTVVEPIDIGFAIIDKQSSRIDYILFFSEQLPCDVGPSMGDELKNAIAFFIDD